MLVNHRAVLNVSCIFSGVLNNYAFKHCIIASVLGEGRYQPFSAAIQGPCRWQTEVLAIQVGPHTFCGY